MVVNFCAKAADIRGGIIRPKSEIRCPETFGDTGRTCEKDLQRLRRSEDQMSGLNIFGAERIDTENRGR